jgi:dihydroorotate dehydrogenase (NAD+) catalytic subunit
MVDLTARVGRMTLRSPLIAASGTVGSVFELAGISDLTAYGAAVAKSVSADPWPGREAPRVAPAGLGMLNGIGIQNPGIDAWESEVAPNLAALDVPVWGSTVGKDPAEFAHVAAGLERAGVAALEINLSCPNLDGHMFSLDPDLSRSVVAEVRSVVTLPIGAKLSPNLVDPLPVAQSCIEAGADFLILTNTIWGTGIDLDTRKPKLSGLIGGYSGPPLKPISLRFVVEVRRSMPQVPIVGCGGVINGADIVEYLLAGASAVEAGTIHLAEPRAGRRLVGELESWMKRNRIDTVSELIGAAL